MRVDVIDLRDFYEQPLGRMVARLVCRQIRLIWPDLKHCDIMGLGYASPYVPSLRAGARRVLNLMPAAQGVIRWPLEGGSLTALVEETSLPLPDAALDRILLVHSLENSEAVRPMLREVWRVLAPSGRLLIVTPNRRGLWARFDRTPFGHGQPYSRTQLTQLMRDMQFTPTRWGRALYTPPFASRSFIRSAAAWEKIGQRAWPRFSGLLMLEAAKQIYALTPEKARHRLLRPVPVPSAVTRIARS